MPIRINLLAEAQALEDLRRRDPLKRAIWVGVFLVALMLAWSSSIQLKAMMGKRELSQLEGQLTSRSNEFHQVLENERRLVEVREKLGALRQLAANRYLHGSVLNALQQTTIEDVQLIRFRTDLSYLLAEEVKPKTNANNRFVPGRPAMVTERILLTLDAKDSGPVPGDQVNKFKQAIADCSYFQSVLGKTNEVRLTNLSPPQTGIDGKPFVLFTLECRYPEKTR